jgi:nucleoside-diphosphate-sugar epimerase
MKVLGGEQLRPNIHMKDMIRLYELLLEVPGEKINRKIYNAGYENLKVKEIAALVQRVVGAVHIEVEETNDQRSYHVCSDKIKRELGFDVQHTVAEAIQELQAAFAQKKITNGDDERYYNVRRMKTLLREGVR